MDWKHPWVLFFPSINTAGCKKKKKRVMHDSHTVLFSSLRHPAFAWRRISLCLLVHQAGFSSNSALKSSFAEFLIDILCRVRMATLYLKYYDVFWVSPPPQKTNLSRSSLFLIYRFYIIILSHCLPSASVCQQKPANWKLFLFSNSFKIKLICYQEMFYGKVKQWTIYWFIFKGVIVCDYRQK